MSEIKYGCQTFDLRAQGADFRVPLTPHVIDSSLEMSAIFFQLLVSL
jgi:hypothetical protein